MCLIYCTMMGLDILRWYIMCISDTGLGRRVCLCVHACVCACVYYMFAFVCMSESVTAVCELNHGGSAAEQKVHYYSMGEEPGRTLCRHTFLSSSLSSICFSSTPATFIHLHISFFTTHNPLSPPQSEAVNDFILTSSYLIPT